MKVRFLKYIKPSLCLPGLFPRIKRVDAIARFTDSCKYIFENTKEQGDLNKLTGIKYYMHATKISAMIAWRYNPNKDVFELFPYFHLGSAEKPEGYIEVGKYRGFITPNPVYLVKAEEEFQFSVETRNGQYIIQIGTWIGAVSHNRLDKPHYRVNGWFGGTLPPPKSMHYFLNHVTK